MVIQLDIRKIFSLVFVSSPLHVLISCNLNIQFLFSRYKVCKNVIFLLHYDDQKPSILCQVYVL